jgi:hypothetical protein
MDIPQVEELIEYTQELEGMVLERKLDDVNDKELILKSIIQDVLISCNDMEEHMLLHDRYPEIYPKPDSETILKNLKKYILGVNRDYQLNL